MNVLRKMPLFRSGKRSFSDIEVELRVCREKVDALNDLKPRLAQRKRALVTLLIRYFLMFYFFYLIYFYFAHYPLRAPSIPGKLLEAHVFVTSIVLVFVVRKIIVAYYEWRLRRCGKFCADGDVMVNFLVVERQITTGNEQMERVLAELKLNEDYLSTQSLLRRFESPVKGEEPFVKSPESQSRSRQPTVPNVSSPLASPQNTSTRSLEPVDPLSVPPRPATPRKVSAIDRVLDFLLGGGNQDKCALICKNCLAHNGLVPPSEFGEISYICPRCGQLNGRARPRPPAGIPPQEELEKVQGPKQNSESEEPVTLEQETETKAETVPEEKGVQRRQRKR